MMIENRVVNVNEGTVEPDAHDRALASTLLRFYFLLIRAERPIDKKIAKAQMDAACEVAADCGYAYDGVVSFRAVEDEVTRALPERPQTNQAADTEWLNALRSAIAERLAFLR